MLMNRANYRSSVSPFRLQRCLVTLKEKQMSGVKRNQNRIVTAQRTNKNRLRNIGMTSGKSVLLTLFVSYFVTALCRAGTEVWEE